MVYDISERRRVMLSMEGLTEPLRGWVKSLDPSSLQVAMRKARDLSPLLESRLLRNLLLFRLMMMSPHQLLRTRASQWGFFMSLRERI